MSKIFATPFHHQELVIHRQLPLQKDSYVIYSVEILILKLPLWLISHLLVSNSFVHFLADDQSNKLRHLGFQQMPLEPLLKPRRSIFPYKPLWSRRRFFELIEATPGIEIHENRHPQSKLASISHFITRVRRPTFL
jgi:hypothetical protein